MDSCISFDSNAQKITIDQVEKNFENISSLDIKGAFCKVIINSHSANNINFKGEIKCNKERDDVKIKYEQKGDKLEIWIEKPNSLRGSFSGSLDFIVPKNTNLNIKNSSGSIIIDNIGKSNISLAASSGSITANSIESNIIATTSSGSIKTINISGNVKATSSSGSHNIENIGGNVVSTLSSGSIKINQVNGTVKSTSSSGSQYINAVKSNIVSSASSGSIKLENIFADVNSKASSGSIKLNNVKGALNLVTSSGSQYGSAITLSGNSSFKSSSGSIKMELTNNSEELSFNLLASSGGLNAKGVSGKKKLNIEKGEIHIHGVSSSGSQSYQ